MVKTANAAGRATRAVVKASRGSRDAPGPSRRGRPGGAAPAAGATQPAPRARLRGNTPARPRAQGGRAEERNRNEKSRTSSDASVVRKASSRRVGYICPPCGRFIATEVDGWSLRATRGSPPRFCSPSCRQAAYRRRQAGVAEDVALQLSGGRGRSLRHAQAKDRRSANA